MTQEKAREIVQSIPSLYPLQPTEEEAILTLLAHKQIDFRKEGYYDRTELVGYCPNCGEFLGVGLAYCTDKFCRICGQPLTDEYILRK